VEDATKPTLSAQLASRTLDFARIPRTPDSIIDFKENRRRIENNKTVDPDIYVCEFVGFTDEARSAVGCMLHPRAAGNNGNDYRGLCHYGSMACKSFFCPSCEHLPEKYANLIIEMVDDWHLYGLLITDIAFVCGLFGILERKIGRLPRAEELIASGSAPLLKEMFEWKNNWLFSRLSTIRWNRYYLKADSRGPDAYADITAILAETYNAELGEQAAERFIRAKIDEFKDKYLAGYPL
jgi:hypothetical protein